MFDILGKTMPVDVALQSIQTNTGGDGLTLRGTAIRSSDLTIFVRNLLISNDVRAVQVSEVKSSKEGQPGFEFTVSVQFGEKTVRTPVQQKKKST
jgi:Tfp pilus assembly protein PilN